MDDFEVEAQIPERAKRLVYAYYVRQEELTRAQARRILADSLGLIPGYLHLPPLRNIVGRVIYLTEKRLQLAEDRSRQAMDRLGVLARAMTSPQSAPAESSPQHIGRSPRFPPEIFERISNHVESALELEALSLAGRVCLAGAQMVLFRNICYVIPPRGDWFADLMEFLTEHPRVASYVRSFGLESHDVTQKAEVDLKIVIDILACLPGLVSFDMLCLTWNIPASPPNLVQHPSLQILTMMGLDITDITHSPFRLMELRPSWRKIDIEYVDCIDPDIANPGLPPVDVGHLTLTSYPFYITDKVRPASYASFTNIASLRAEYVSTDYAECMTRLVTGSADTLQYLRFTLNPHEPMISAEDWEGFFLAIRSCPKLLKVALTFTLDSSQRDADHGFTMGLLGAVRNSVSCLNLIVELKGTCAKNYSDDLASFDWRALGRAYKDVASLRTLRIKIFSYNEPRTIWYQREVRVIKQSFPSLPDFSLNSARNVLQFYRSTTDRPVGVALIKYHPSATTDRFELL